MKFSIAKIMSKTLPVALLSLTIPMLILSACGGGGGGSTGGTTGGSGGGNVLTQMGGALQGMVLNLTREVSTFAGLSSQNKNADGIGGAASFRAPLASVTDGTNLYIADSANNTIRKVVILTGEVTTLAGSSVAVTGAGWLDDTGTAALFNKPSGITLHGENLYIADTNNHSIRKISPSIGTLKDMTSATAVVSTLAGSTIGFADGAGSLSKFRAPTGITTHNEKLYVADTGNHKIRVIAVAGVLSTMTSATAEVTTLSGSLAAAVAAGSNDDSDRTKVTFNTPSGIITYGNYLYVADKGNNKIRRVVIADNTNTNEFRGGTTSFTGNDDGKGFTSAIDGSATAVTFSGPTGITRHGEYLYVADTGNNKIRKVAFDGATTSLTGTVSVNTGTAAGYADDTASSATFSSATFNAPAGITTDGTNLYVSDTGNNTIRKIFPKSNVTLATMTDATASVSTLAGVATRKNPADGSGMAARMDTPEFSTTDGTNLYVTSCGTTKAEIRKIVIATGVVTTLAGSAVGVSGDGTGTMATFTCPQGITTDGINLYVVDGTLVRKIAPATGTLAAMTSANAAVSTMAASGVTFIAPIGITTDGTSLYVADGSNVVRISAPGGAMLSSMAAASGVASLISGAGAGSVPFVLAYGITTDGKNLFVADIDGSKNNIVKISPPMGWNLSSMAAASAVVSSITTASAGGSADGNAATAALFLTPADITTDGVNLYVVDYNNNKIRMIAPTGNATLANITAASAVVSSITGVSGFTGRTGYVDGAGSSATFGVPFVGGPTGITTDGVSLYVTDRANGTIRKIR